MEKINKMVEVLTKFARDGKETPVSNRLKNNLIKILKNKSLLEVADIEALTKKQSLDSCLMASVKVLTALDKKKAVKNAVAAQKRAATIASKPKAKRGYYTNDICQQWISEDSPDFNEEDYREYQRCCYLARRGRL